MIAATPCSKSHRNGSPIKLATDSQWEDCTVRGGTKHSSVPEDCAFNDVRRLSEIRIFMGERCYEVMRRKIGKG